MKNYLFILFLSISVITCKKEPEPEPVAEIGDIYAGGIVFKLNASGQGGMVCSLADIGPYKQNEAIDVCHASNESGFNDWRMPSTDQLNLMYENLHKQGLGDFEDRVYWNAEYIESVIPFRGVQNFSNGEQNTIFGNNIQHLARPVRFF